MAAPGCSWLLPAAVFAKLNVPPRENVHSLKISYVGAIILEKVISRRQSFYVPTINYCRFFIEKYEISWG